LIYSKHQKHYKRGNCGHLQTRGGSMGNEATVRLWCGRERRSR